MGLSSEEALKALGPPEIFHHIVAGLSEVDSLLEIEASKSAPEALQRQCSGLVEKKRKCGKPEEEEEPNPLIAVFATRADVDGPDYSDRYQIFSHLPDLVARASLSPTGLRIYLVSLPKGAMYKISEAMDLGRIGILGLRQNAPGTSLLLTFLKENVPLCTLPTLEVKQSEAGNRIRLDS